MNANRSTIACGVAMAILLAPSALLPARALAQDSTGDEPRFMPAPIQVQYFRPHDQRGIGTFEPPKQEGVPYRGFAIQWGAAFTQQYQALHHGNQATPVIVSGTNVNALMPIGKGFNNAMANLYMDTQLARGIRVELTSYLSTRHHNETWVKDGYLLIDGSPWKQQTLDDIMRWLTLRVGHFEINYGDMHFRRSDGGNTMFNPLIGNLVMDAFTTEIGAEAYARSKDLLGMVGVTGGEIRGNVTQPAQRAPSYLAKAGVDHRFDDQARVRLTASLYTTKRSINNTLYSGSRTGSRYYFVLENTLATESAQAWSGDLQPGLRSKVTAWVVNPYLEFHGLELFGNIEQAKGRAANEAVDRTFHQYAGDLVYRFFDRNLYLATRYNWVKGRMPATVSDVTVERFEGGGGWFITPNIEMKAEYVHQVDENFVATDIRSHGKFEGMMIEGVVSF
jgi:hypothetical protein